MLNLKQEDKTIHVEGGAKKRIKINKLVIEHILCFYLYLELQKLEGATFREAARKQDDD